MKIVIEGKVDGVTIRIEEEYNADKEWKKRYNAIRQWRRAAVEIKQKEEKVKDEEAPVDWDALLGAAK